MSDTAPWEDFKPAAPAAPAAGGAAPWEDFKPAAPRAGAAAIPTEAEAAGKPYAAAPGSVTPKPAPTIAGNVTGTVEAAINAATGIIGGLVGGLTALPVSAASAASELQRGGIRGFKSENTLNPIEAMDSVSQGVAGSLKHMVSGPADLRQEQQPDSELGQKYTEQYVQPAMETLMAVAPLHGTMGPKGAVTPALDAVRRASGASPEAFAAAKGAQAVKGAVVEGARKVMSIDPELAKVAQTAGALKYPIDVRPDQIVEGAKFSKLAGQAASDVPLSGSKKSSNQVAFTRNAIDLINPEETKADRLTPEVFDQAMRRSGGGIGEIMARTDVPEADIAHGMESVRNSLSKATEDNRRIVSDYLSDIKNAAAENDGVLSGTRLKEINSQIGQQARSNAGNDLGRYLNNLQDVIQDSVERNADPADIQPLRDFRRQYAYGKMMEPAISKTIDGKLSPARLMQLVTATKQGKHYMARAMGGPIGDLAKVGQIIKEPGSSLTAERGAVYTGLAGAAHFEPHTAAGIYAGANIYNRGGPMLTRALVGKRAKKGAAPPEAPPEPTTSPGAGPDAPPSEGSGGQGPLGDLTPDWETTPGAGGGAARGGSEPGLVPAVGEKPITRFVPDRKAEAPAKRAGSEIPPVPGRPGLPDSMLTGRPRETAASERANAAMEEPGAQEAIKRLRLADEEAARKEIPVGEVTEGAPAEKPAGKPEKIPVGKVIEGQPEIKTEKTGKIPVGEATEIKPRYVERGEKKLPIGEATELTPELIEADKKWRTDHKLGEEDAGRARDVARALGYDEKAVEAAARQHDNSPRAFDREVARINEKGEAHANESKQAARGGESDAGGAGASGGRDSAASVRAGEGAGDRTAPVREAAAQPEPASAVRAAADEPRANGASAAEPGRGGAEPAGRQGQVARDAARANGVEIHEVPGGFEARRDGKKVGYLKDNLERGQAKQLDENANVNMVKVDEGEVGQGTGRALYEAFHEKHEGRILPSGKTEPSAWKLWKRNYPEKVDQFVKDEAQRIRDGADPGLVARNITDAEVRSRVLKESERGTDPEPDNQPGGVRKEDRRQDAPENGTLDKAADQGEKEVQELGKNGSRQADAGGGPLDKSATGPRTPVGSAEKMDSILRERFGDKFIQGLIDQGVLKYEDSNPMRPWSGATMNPGVAGSEIKPHATLYYDKLRAEQVPGVLMHELGEHFGIVRLLGSERYGVMLSELRGLKSTPEVREAWDAVKRNYTDRDARIVEGGTVFMREVAARLVESHPDLPFVRRLVNEIRAFFYEHFGTTMGNRVDASLIRGLAASALRKASAGDLPQMNTPVRAFVPPPKTSNQSAPRRFVQ